MAVSMGTVQTNTYTNATAYYNINSSSATAGTSITFYVVLGTGGGISTNYGNTVSYSIDGNVIGDWEGAISKSSGSSATIASITTTTWNSGTHTLSATIYIRTAGSNYTTGTQTLSVSVSLPTITTTTATYLRVGTSTNPSATSYTTSRPFSTTVYFRVNGLQSTFSNYTRMIFATSPVTQGTKTYDGGTIVTSVYPDSSNGGNYYAYASVSVANTNFRVGQSRSIYAIAQNSSGYYNVGSSTGIPVTLRISNNFTSYITASVGSITNNSAVVTFNASSSYMYFNSTRYYGLYVSSSYASQSGTNNITTLGRYTGLPSSSSSSLTVTVSLSAGTRYSVYPVVEPSSTNVGSYYFYGLTPIDFITDQSSYSATIGYTGLTSNSVYITISGLSSTTNLGSNWYVSATNTSYTTSLSYGNNYKSRNTSIELTGLSSGTSYTRYAYVYSTASGRYYRIGSTSFTTDQSSYSATVTRTALTSSSATFTISNLSSTTNLNSSWYISTTNATYTTSLSSSSSASRSSSITLSGLSSGTSYTRYAYVYSSRSGRYYKVAEIKFTTDVSNYSAPLTVVSGTSSSVTIGIGDVTPSTGLTNYWYLSSTNTASTTSLTTVGSASSRDTNITLSGLSAGSSYTRYAYVQSSSSGTYYRVGSIGFRTDSTSYNANVYRDYGTPNSATIVMGSLNSTYNLDGMWYLSTTNASTATSLVLPVSNNIGYAITLNDLVPGTLYTRHAYVYSELSDTYYKIGTVNFTTAASSYTGSLVLDYVNTNEAEISVTLDVLTDFSGYITLSTTDVDMTDDDILVEDYGETGLDGNVWFYLSSLEPNHEYTYYAYALSNGGLYHQFGSITFTTDSESYVATTSIVNTTYNSAILSFDDVTPTANLDGKWYLGDAALPSATPTASAPMSTNIKLTGLTENTTYNMLVWVQTATGGYYEAGSITFTTPTQFISNGFKLSSASICTNTQFNMDTEEIDATWVDCNTYRYIDGKWVLCSIVKDIT